MLYYEYTKENQLRKAHNYMYAPYLGGDFINIYFNDRIKNLNRADSIYKKQHDDKVYSYFINKSNKLFSDSLHQDLLNKHYNIDSPEVVLLAEKKIYLSNLAPFNIKNDINTLELLSSLIFNLINDYDEDFVKKWLDLLVQRFEVTKKIYTKYQAGLVKGSGESDKLQLYCLFALSLSLYFVKKNSLKHLSTLLKVSDLLCSIENEVLRRTFSSRMFSLILLFEISIIMTLSKKLKGVDFVFE